MKKNYPYGSGIVKWITADWLHENLKKQEITILDVQPNIHDYIEQHIPGAIYLNEGLLRTYINGMPARYVPLDTIQPILRYAGLKQGVPAVVYTGTGAAKGWGDGLEQTMMAYSLARFGHDCVYVLDGGLDKWKGEGKPLTKEFPKTVTSDFTVRVQSDFYIQYEEFKAAKDRKDVMVLDARPPDGYEGQSYWIKPGHIPGAVNVPWASLMTDANKSLLKSDEKISAILKANDVRPDKTIICTCGTGREATNEFILFKWYFNYPSVKIYEGSFTEWTAYPENPTVTGKNPR
ncbi:MAG: sulfurtransferase [Syntrophales bacterium]|jgi:thiosulfate/3-mercaptopyruvate sulfurtransferase